MVNYTGLTHFIRDINLCMNKDSEYKRIEEELANIRKAFAGKPGSYDKRKYVWKLAYIQLLGHEVISGHMEAIELLSSQRYVEKAVGYIAVSILIPVDHEFATLVVNSMRSDMLSPDESFKVIALTAIANMGGHELAENVFEDIVKLAQDDATSNIVKSRAINSLMSLYRSAKDSVSLEFLPSLIPLLTHGDLGVVNSATNLFESAAAIEDEKTVKRLVRGIAEQLDILAVKRTVDSLYIYRDTPHPWLQVKLLQLLQHYPYPDDKKTAEKVASVLDVVFTQTKITKDRNKNNVDHSILFEAINLVIHYGENAPTKVRKQAVGLLGNYISDEGEYGASLDTSAIKYLTLDRMGRLAALEGASSMIQKHKKLISACLENPDVSIRKKAIHVMFTMCDENVAMDIVKELLDYLQKADFSVKEEMILKIAILAEKFAPTFTWYVDVVLQMVTGAGDFVTDDIWFRAVQIISQHADIQEYATRKLYYAMLAPDVHETIIKCAGYVIGEYGVTLNDAREDPLDPTTILTTLMKHIKRVSKGTRALLLHACFKLMIVFSAIQPAVEKIFAQYEKDMDPEIQQRVVEYKALMQDEDVMLAVMEEMPPFPMKESGLVKRLKKMTTHKKDSAEADSEEEEEEEDSEDSDASESGSDEGAADIMSGGGASSKKAAPAAPSSGGDLMDLFGLSTPAVDTKKFLKNCLISPKAVLYEDSQIQIGCQHEYKGDQGRMQLFYTCRGGPLSGIQVSFGNSNGGVLTQAQPAPSALAPGQSIPQPLMLKAAKPFTEAPTFSFSAGAISLQLSLPVHLISFCSPANLVEAAFESHWQGLNGKEIIRKINGATNGTTVGQFLPRMRFGSVTSGSVIQAATTLRVAGTSIGVLVRVEVKTGKVAVRSTNADVCKGILNAMEIVLDN